VRRFITSLPGKVIGQVVIAALILPSVTLALFTRASAQIATLPSWAVTEFVNKKSSGTTYGVVAAKALSSELAKTGHVDVVPDDTMSGAIGRLAIASPPDGLVNLLRLGQEVGASSITRGEIVDYRVQPAGGGRQASVVIRVVIYDVASGLPVNGAALRGVSSIRTGTVSDETLIGDAFGQACSSAVKEIESHRLPVGTVLNTQDTKALINKGSRSGFVSGQEVIVLRNHEQVATGRVTEVEPDSSYIVGNNIVRGIQPGDHVRVIFKVADIDVDPAGGPHVRPVKNTSFPSGLLSLALVVGLVAALVGGGNGGSAGTVNDVTASSYMYLNNTPAVQINWSNTAFAGGTYQRVAYQIWRSDVPTSPVGVALGNVTDFVDPQGAGTLAGALTYSSFPSNTVGNNTVCNYSTFNNTSNSAIIPSIIPGQSYYYQVEEVFDLLSIDLPNGGSSVTSTGSTGSSGTTSGSSGTTSTTSGGSGTTSTTSGGSGTTSTTSGGSGTTSTTSGGSGTTSTTSGGSGTTSTTSGSSGTTSGTGGTVCYFLSARVTAIGQATPINRPVLNQPAEGTTVQANAATQFSVNSVVSTSTFEAEYVLEFASTPNFAKGTFVRMPSFFSYDTGTGLSASASTVNPATYFPNATPTTNLYWRFGARAAADVPGPSPDALTHERYIFSNPRLFHVPASSPPPPKSVGKHHHVGTGKGG